jgi:hypothetical protein
MGTFPNFFLVNYLTWIFLSRLTELPFKSKDNFEEFGWNSTEVFYIMIISILLKYSVFIEKTP